MADPSTYRPAPGSVPEGPGVYRFRDPYGRVIYVGKAKSLRQRLGSYFQDLSGLHPRTQTMVTTASSVEWTVVATEVEAFQLEYSWIKEFDPRFNVKYRDDKSYPYLAVTLSEEVPRSMVMRGAVLAAVLVLEPSIREIQRLLAGTGELDRAVSVLADLITFILVAPLLLTALSFRGGRLFGVYALLTAGTIGWMINQGSGTVLTFLGMTGATRAGQMFGFAMACACIASAAYVQWKGAGSEVVHA